GARRPAMAGGRPPPRRAGPAAGERASPGAVPAAARLAKRLLDRSGSPRLRQARRSPGDRPPPAARAGRLAQRPGGRRLPPDDLAGRSELLDRQQPAGGRRLPADRSRQADPRAGEAGAGASRRAGAGPPAHRGRGLLLLAAPRPGLGRGPPRRFRPPPDPQARHVLELVRMAGRGRLLLDEDSLTRPPSAAG